MAEKLDKMYEFFTREVLRSDRLLWICETLKVDFFKKESRLLKSFLTGVDNHGLQQGTTLDRTLDQPSVNCPTYCLISCLCCR